MQHVANLKSIFNIATYRSIIQVHQDLFWAIPARYYENMKDEVVETQTLLEKLKGDADSAILFTHTRDQKPDDVIAHVDLMDTMANELDSIKDFFIRSVGFIDNVPSRDEIEVQGINSGELINMRDRFMRVVDTIQQVAGAGVLDMPLTQELAEATDPDITTLGGYVEDQMAKVSDALERAALVIQFEQSDDVTVIQIQGMIDALEVNLTNSLQMMSGAMMQGMQEA